MRRKLVPLARRHAVQAKIAVVVNRTVHRAAFILMHVGSYKGRLGWPHRPREHPRDTIRAVLAHEQTVALPNVLLQHVVTLGVKPGMDKILPLGIVEATQRLLLASGAASERVVR